MKNKLEILKRNLKKEKRLLVAYSGGLDSTFLLREALDALGNRNVLAVTAVSPSIPSYEIAEAEDKAERMGAPHLMIESLEMSNEMFFKNPADRCFWCKSELFSALNRIASKHNMAVADGVNRDDYGDYRPGIRAGDEHGVKHPLADCGLTKQEIREAARRTGLPNWNKPAYACLASRIPYGEEITAEKLSMAAEAELLLRRRGFRQVRVRVHGRTARIEVETEMMRKLFDERQELAGQLRDIGFDHVSVDLEGYFSGSMNRNIKK